MIEQSICRHCSRDNYGSVDSTCGGCGAPIRVSTSMRFEEDAKYASAQIKSSIVMAGFGMCATPPPPPPACQWIQF